MDISVGDHFVSNWSVVDYTGLLLDANNEVVVTELLPGDECRVRATYSGILFTFSVWELTSSFKPVLLSPTPASLTAFIAPLDLSRLDERIRALSLLLDNPAPTCECGQRGVEWAIHSDYCPLYIKA